MRKLTLCIVALLITGTFSSTFAQQGLEVGAYFTPGSPWILNDEDFAEGADLDYRGTFGFLVGGTVGYNFSDKLGIQTGLAYAKLGQNYITDYAGLAKDEQSLATRSLNYMRIPIMFKLNGALDKKASMYFRIGPHFDLLSSARYKGEIKALGTSTEFDFDLVDYDLGTGTVIYNDIYKKFVVGITMEVGGQINISENMKILTLFHLSGSLTNPEGADAPNVFPSSGTVLAPTRGTAWNAMVGLTIGFNYVIAFN